MSTHSETRLISPTTPSILGADTTRVALSPITLWPIATIPSVHVFPGSIDVPRFEAAVQELARLYPVVAGRLGRGKKDGGDRNSYWIDLTSSPIPLTLTTSHSTAPPFPTSAVIQPSLDPYIDAVDPTQLNAPSTSSAGALLRFKLTHLPNAAGGERTVLGVSFGHIIGDGAAFCVFMRMLGRLYEGEQIGEGEWWNWGPHVNLIERPREEALQKWEHHILWPTSDLPTAWGKYGAAADGDVVQWVLTPEEIKTLKTLASGIGDDEWVSEQDAISSYWINLLNLGGDDVRSVINSVNYRNLFPSHPAFPPTLPRLCANVAQLWDQPFPPQDGSSLSLIPVARAIRQGLQSIRDDPEMALEWLSCRACRMQQTADHNETQAMVARPGECIVNSNWRYDWNVPFGFPVGQTQHHTSFSSKNFLRVFKTNPSGEEQGAELTFQVRRGLKGAVEAELARDRSEGWSRWRRES